MCLSLGQFPSFVLPRPVRQGAAGACAQVRSVGRLARRPKSRSCSNHALSLRSPADILDGSSVRRAPAALTLRAGRPRTAHVVTLRMVAWCKEITNDPYAGNDQLDEPHGPCPGSLNDP